MAGRKEGNGWGVENGCFASFFSSFVVVEIGGLVLDRQIPVYGGRLGGGKEGKGGEGGGVGGGWI